METIWSKALFERPALSLEINGSVDTNADRLPLAHLKLEEQVKSLWVKEQQDAGRPAVSLDQVQLDPAERERLVRKIYKIRFGPYQPSQVDTNQTGGRGVNSRMAWPGRGIAGRAARHPEARGRTRLLVDPRGLKRAPGMKKKRGEPRSLCVGRRQIFRRNRAQP